MALGRMAQWVHGNLEQSLQGPHGRRELTLPDCSLNPLMHTCTSVIFKFAKKGNAYIGDSILFYTAKIKKDLFKIWKNCKQ